MNEAIKQAVIKFKTQERLAKAIGVRQSLISHYLNGRRTPTKKTAQRLESVCGEAIPWYAFIDGSIEVIEKAQSSGVNSTADDAV